MANPLSPAGDAALNCPVPIPATGTRYDRYEVKSFRTQAYDSNSEDTASSPIVLDTTDVITMSDQENMSPSKRGHTRVISGTELSPLKILSRKRSSTGDHSDGSMAPPPLRCPRKLSPEKRFPVKVSGSSDTFAMMQERKTSVEQLIRKNEDLKRAIDIFEDENSLEQGTTLKHSTTDAEEEDLQEDGSGPDDTIISTFSTFSAVPDMTMLTRMGQSPTKMSSLRGVAPLIRSESRASATSRPSTRDDPSNTSNLLMDFVDSARFPHKSPDKRAGLSSSHTMSNLAATPNNRTMTNLIDFDIPPMPTPRSVPTISAREVESLKSRFLSEISSLKASLSGKEAEVHSLKAAVGDAEKRVGETMEQLREENALREQLSAERGDWEKRGSEMEQVLRTAKEEIAVTQRHQEELEQKLEESDKRREAAEILHQEAESKIAGMRAGKECENTSSSERPKDPSATSKEVELAVERVARELHALYKGKHETKVTALKKSYEARWEKKVRELESRVSQLVVENEKLRGDRSNTTTEVKFDNREMEARKEQAIRDSATIKELNAGAQRLEAVVTSLQKDNEDLRGQLEKERVEKGELVQLAEEMMSMQQNLAAAAAAPPPPAAHPPPSSRRMSTSRPSESAMPMMPAKTPRRSVDTRTSIGRASGLRTPGSSLKQSQDRIKIGSSISRPSLGPVSRSGNIMTSIEKMGSYRGRGQD